MTLSSNQLQTRKRGLSGHRTLVAQTWGFKFESQVSLCKVWYDHVCLKPQWLQAETQDHRILLAVSLPPYFRTRVFLRKIKQSALKQYIQHPPLASAYSYTHNPHTHPARITIKFLKICIKLCTNWLKLS